MNIEIRFRIARFWCSVQSGLIKVGFLFSRMAAGMFALAQKAGDRSRNHLKILDKEIQDAR